jgi:hypothetical protein
MYDHEIEKQRESHLSRSAIQPLDLTLVDLERLKLFGVIVVVELETCVATALKPLLCDISTAVDF